MAISRNLANLAKAGKLKTEPGDQREFDNLLRSASRRLADSRRRSLAIESRFDLAYNAAHSLALAALRWHGYRSENRYLVFQCVEHTLGLGPDVWRVLALCHERRNVFEYKGEFEIDETLFADLLRTTEILLEKVTTLGPVR